MTKVRIGSRGMHSGNTIEYMTTATTLDAQDSGKVFSLHAAALYSITLPTTLIAGLHYMFYVEEDTPTGAITIAAGSAIIYGNLSIQSDTDEDNRVACAGGSNVIIGIAAKKGDSVEFICDGSSWYVRGFGQVQTSFTVS